MLHTSALLYLSRFWISLWISKVYWWQAIHELLTSYITDREIIPQKKIVLWVYSIATNSRTLKNTKGFPLQQKWILKNLQTMHYELWIRQCAHTSHYSESKELENGKPLLANRPNFKEKKFLNFLEYQYT